MKVPPQTKTWDWWSSRPMIKGCFTTPGTLEVFWDPPNAAVRKQIKSYQVCEIVYHIYMLGVCQRQKIELTYFLILCNLWPTINGIDFIPRDNQHEIA